MLTIALLQMQPYGTDQDANLARGEQFCRRAAAMGADIALFPEMWNIGYTHDELRDEAVVDPAATNVWRSPEYWPEGAVSPLEGKDEAIARYHAHAIDRDGPFVTHFRRLARELDMAVAITYLERWDPLPRNSVSLIDRHGELVFTYAKVHTCAFDLPECVLSPGDDFYVAPLDTVHGDVQIGAMICYDREFPESARVLMLKGAEIILTPNACDLEINRIAGFRTRAAENMVGVALANYAGPGFGHSIAFDGIAFAGGRSRDMLLVEAGEGEGVYLASFNLEALREYRRREAWGNAFRRPQCYRLLASADVAEPFIRVNVEGAAHHET
ncbi:MAG TPA: carbon-nitrogen hydrolase family protein [Chloroflexota bacterium]|nr:carbon-nitrogen hydrolase family protein [Chloroflexota bacterium]